MAEITIGDVTVKRSPTKKGERLRVATDDETVALDAIQLESMAWQDRDELWAFLGLDAHPDGPVVDAETTETGVSVRIVNEYAQVAVSQETTPAGPRLRIDSLKLGYTKVVGKTILSSIANTETTRFREFLEEPFGPGNEETHNH